MELKEYQKKTLDQVKGYLDSLAEYKGKNEKAIAVDPDLAIDFPFKAWEKVVRTSFHSGKNGLGKPLPDFYLKIPTGGGKTILACHAIDLINRIYLKKQTGIVLWIVPTTQIYRQTLSSLKNREHPYRQVLDISSGGKTLILEKLDKFTPLDIEENLVVMLLMLPSASRQNKETLKVFKDSGGFTEFFPYEDDIEGIDLLSRDCGIRYIITKQALQEGWDCAFAYILTVLTNPGSQLSITQLVGRILRQYKARKTKVKDLDESYVFLPQAKSGRSFREHQEGF